MSSALESSDEDKRLRREWSRLDMYGAHDPSRSDFRRSVERLLQATGVCDRIDWTMIT